MTTRTTAAQFQLGAQRSLANEILRYKISIIEDAMVKALSEAVEIIHHRGRGQRTFNKYSRPSSSLLLFMTVKPAG